MLYIFNGCAKINRLSSVHVKEFTYVDIASLYLFDKKNFKLKKC